MKNILILSIVIFPFFCNAQIIITAAGNGSLGETGDGGPATMASISNPRGIAFDSHKNYYFTDVEGNTIRKVTSSGIISTIAGTVSGAGYNGDGIQATDAQLNNPSDIVIDSLGNIFIADTYNNRIRKINVNTGVISTIAGNGTAGFGGDGSTLASAILNGPFSLCFDHAGNLYISDAVNYRIRKVNAAGIITTIVGNGVYGFSGDSGPATAAEIQGVQGMCTDDIGNLYLAQTMNLRIRKIDTVGIITTIAGTGATGPTGDNGLATAAALDPVRLAFDRSGNLYVSTYTNNNVRKIDKTGIIHTIAGNGIYGSIGDGGPAIEAEVSTTNGIAFDTCGNLYIADFNNNRIRKVEFNPTCINEEVNNIKERILIIYPNPAYDILNINNLKTQATYHLLSVVGEVVQQGNLKEGSNSIDIVALANGMYMLEIIDKEGKRIVTKIIKQ